MAKQVMVTTPRDDTDEIMLNISPDVALRLAKNILAQVDLKRMPPTIQVRFEGKAEVIEF